MSSRRKSAYFQPTVPLPPQTVLSVETELTYFRHRRPLLLETELRPFTLRNHSHHPYGYPIARRGVTPDRDCLDWPQYPLTLPVGTAIRRTVETTSTRARSRQATPAPSTSPRQSTPGPSTTPNCAPLSVLRKSVRFPTSDGDDDDGDDDERDNQEADTAGVAMPDEDGLISKPDGEVGRRKRGYSLAAVLGWTQTKFKSTKDSVNSYIEDYLNHSLSASNQPQGYVDNLTQLILAKHPGLVDQYRDGWPIRDMIHLRLKYTSGRFSNGQVVAQGKNYPQDLKKALKDIREQAKGTKHASAASDKGKQRATSAVS